MKPYGIVLFCALAACGNVDICKNPDMYLANGICVTMNGYDNISQDEIEYVIGETEREVILKVISPEFRPLEFHFGFNTFISLEKK